MRNDGLLQENTITVLRARDLVSTSRTVSFDDAYVHVLGEADDYMSFGLGTTFGIGSSVYYWVLGYGFFDLIGVWDRCLRDEEVERLFNNGLGWTPG